MQLILAIMIKTYLADLFRPDFPCGQLGTKVSRTYVKIDLVYKLEGVVEKQLFAGPVVEPAPTCPR